MSLPTPINRNEQYLNAIANGDPSDLPTPITREEQYLDYIARNGGGSGDGDMKKSVYDSDLAVANAGGISAFVNDAVSGKVDKVAGKGLSTNDYSDTEKSKVAANTSAIEAIENVTGAKNELDWSNITLREILCTATKTDTGVRITTESPMQFAYVQSSDFNLRKNEQYIFSLDLSVTNGNCYAVVKGRISSSSYTEISDLPATNGHNEYTFNSGDYLSYVIEIYGSLSEAITVDVTYSNIMLRDARITDPTYVPYAMTNRELTERVENIGGGLSVETYQVTLDSNSYSQWGWVYVVDKNGNSVTPEDGIFLRAWGESSNSVLTMDFAVIAEFGNRWMGRVRKVGNIADVTGYYGTMNFSFLRIS